MLTKLRPLYWTFDYQGQWWSESIHGGFYRIGICDDGTFDVSESDVELIGTKAVECLDTLKAAKAFCDECERRGR